MYTKRKVFVLAVFTPVLVCAKPWIPRIQPGQYNDACNYAKVVKVDATGYLTIREQPDRASRKIDRLRPSAPVYVCNSTKEWYGLYYKAPGYPCAAGTLDGIDVNKVASCQAGWAPKASIDLLSG